MRRSTRRTSPLRRATAQLGELRRLVRRRFGSPLAHRVLRRRGGSWVLAVALAVTVAVLVGRAEVTERHWGGTASVVVATRDLPAGRTLGSDDVAVRRWPRGLVPPDALDVAPEGRRLAHPVTRGEPVVARRLARTGAGATAARLDGRGAAVSVPLGSAGPTLEVGDRVDVLAPAPRQDPWDTSGTAVRVVARAAEVVELGDAHATLVVRRDEVQGAAAAVLAGHVTVALVG